MSDKTKFSDYKTNEKNDARTLPAQLSAYTFLPHASHLVSSLLERLPPTSVSHPSQMAPACDPRRSHPSSLASPCSGHTHLSLHQKCRFLKSRTHMCIKKGRFLKSRTHIPYGHPLGSLTPGQSSINSYGSMNQ